MHGKLVQHKRALVKTVGWAISRRVEASGSQNWVHRNHRSGNYFGTSAIEPQHRTHKAHTSVALEPPTAISLA
jgi:hypothetical protein